MAKLKVKSWEASWDWKRNRGRLEYEFDNGQSGGVADLLADDFNAAINLLNARGDKFVNQATQSIYSTS